MAGLAPVPSPKRGACEPLDLRPGSFTLQVIELDMDTDPLTGLPVVRVPPGTKTFTSEDVRRAMEEDD